MRCYFRCSGHAIHGVLRAVMVVAGLGLGFEAVAKVQESHHTGRVKIMAYNVGNMFDVFDDPYTNDEGANVKPRSAIEKVARMVRYVDADVVAFSEIENEGILRAMVHEFLPGAGYKDVAVMATNSSRGINLGVISRLPIKSLTSHRFARLVLPDAPRTWRFARDLLRVRVVMESDHLLDIYVAHFKSKLDSLDDPNSAKWRLAEAIATGEIIAEARRRNPDVPAVLVGDLNDTPDSAVLRAIYDSGLVDVHAHLHEDHRVTYLRHPYRSTIDYILADRQMARRLVPGSALVPHDQKLISGSDHAPVVAAFTLGRQHGFTK